MANFVYKKHIFIFSYLSNGTKFVMFASKSKYKGHNLTSGL